MTNGTARFFRLSLGALLATAGVGLPVSAVEEKRIAALFRPLMAEQVAMSPDGRQIAYTAHERDELSVFILPLENPSAKYKVTVEGDREVTFSKEREPAKLRYLRWSSTTRLVFATTEERVAPGRLRSIIYGVDADARNARALADERDFKYTFVLPREEGPPTFLDAWRRFNLLGPVAGDPEHVWVEALGVPAPRRPPPLIPVGPAPTSLFKVNVHTGKVSRLTDEEELGEYLYDWEGRPRILKFKSENSPERRFLHRHPGVWTRWNDLDPAWIGGTAQEFMFSPERYFDPRAYPLAFDGRGEALYFASNLGRNTVVIEALDLTTKQRRVVAEHPEVDLAPLEPPLLPTPLLFDLHRRSLAGVRAAGVVPVTVWTDPELAAVQRELERKFPQRTVEILEWSERRDRFLLRVWGGSDPGRYMVFKRPENLVVDLLRRAPWLRNADLHESLSFEFDAPHGPRLSGQVTWPRRTRLAAPPVVVLFADTFNSKAARDFSPEMQALADMGVAVVQVYHRGTLGLGASHWSRASIARRRKMPSQR